MAGLATIMVKANVAAKEQNELYRVENLIVLFKVSPVAWLTRSASRLGD
jgi:hypothetical protein